MLKYSYSKKQNLLNELVNYAKTSEEDVLSFLTSGKQDKFLAN